MCRSDQVVGVRGDVGRRAQRARKTFPDIWQSGKAAIRQAGNLAATTSIARCSAHIRSAPLASHFFPFSRAFRGTILSQSWEILDRTLLVIDEHSLFNFSTDASPLNLLSLVRVLFQLALTISSASKFVISWLLNRKQFASFDFSTSAEPEYCEDG